MDTTTRTNPEGAADSGGSPGLHRAEVMLLAVVLIWALNFPVAKWAIGEINILTFNAIRYILAAACIGLALPFISSWKAVGRGDWKKLVGLGLLANVIYQSAFIIGLALTTAGNSAVILATAPLWTALLNSVIYKERIRAGVWAGLTISFVGVVMIITGSGKHIEFGSSSVWGDLITLLAAFLWGLNTNAQKPLVRVYPSMQVTFVSVAVGAVILPLISIPASLTMDWSKVSWLVLAATAASGILSIGVSYIVWAYGVKIIGPARTANFGNLVPVIAFAVSYFLLKEQYAALQIAGAAVTLCGVWLARR